MDFHKLSDVGYARELLTCAAKLGMNAHLLPKKEGGEYIALVIGKFRPLNTMGHVQVSDPSGEMDYTEGNEYAFPLKMNAEPAYVFFAQNDIDRHHVVVIENALNISKIMEKSYGMEYFISNKEMSFLVSVNVYAIGWAGAIDLS